MRNLIPPFIHTQYQAGRWQGQFTAASLFVDISGFTHLTETLMQHGKDGAEVLTDALNRVFGPLVQAVYAHGGLIATFAGDAFTALFPLRRRDAALYAAQTAFFIQQFFAQYGNVQTKYGRFALSARVGLAMGAVQWGILGRSGRHAYFFHGPAVEACAHAEHLAQPGEIMAAPELMPLLRAQVTALPLETHYRLTGLRLERPAKQVRLHKLHREALTPFVLDAAINLAESGASAEFRQVAPLFISVDQPRTSDTLNAFISTVIDLTTNYSGYFNKLDFGDKGTVLLVLFGAPVTHENDLERAADMLMALCKLAANIGWRAGLTFGTAYAGIIGGTEQCEYTAIGDTVNLASRLMQSAAWGEVRTSDRAAEQLRKEYQVDRLGEFTLKGKSLAQPVYRLTCRKALAETAFYVGMLVGREAELEQLGQFVRPILAGRFAGLVYIYGEPGMGKSRLVYELRRRLAQTSRFTCPADEILRQSLNPFRYFLRERLSQSSDRSMDENKASFDQALDALIADLRAIGVVDLASELERTRSFLGALVDLRWEGSLYEQLESRLRFDNTLVALTTLIRAESLRRPVVLHIEDAHWLDADSPSLIQRLTRQADTYPFMILLTSRYRDDGSRFIVQVDADVPQQMIDLNALLPDGVRAIATQALGGEVTNDLAAFLVEKTDGNPFFVEQLTFDLRERGMTQIQDGQWMLAHREIGGVPTSINAVLVARLDRLVAQVKAVVQAAAVLGHEFEVQVLSQMLRGDALLLAKVKQAEAEAIWTALSEIRYIFRHALLRDAAYDMQLRARLRELHTLAGAAIEQVYANDLTPHCADLAYHYGKAGDLTRERCYARLAGESAAARFANAEAIAYLSRALELTPEADAAERYELVKAREKVYDLLGARPAQAQDLDTLTRLAEQLDDAGRRVQAALRRSHYTQVTGDYSAASAAAQQAVTLAHAVGLVASEAAGHLDWGRSLLWHADYEAALGQLEQALALAQAVRSADPRSSLAGNVEADGQLNLGNVAWRRGHYAEAQAFFEQALRLYRAIGDRRGECGAVLYLGIVTFEQGDYGGARPYFAQALSLYRAIGDRRGENLSLNDLGVVAETQGDYAEAEAYYRQFLQLARETGDRESEGFALGNLGEVASRQGDYARSQVFQEQSLYLRREIGNREGECMSLVALGLLLHQTRNDHAALDYSRQGLRLAQEIGARPLQARALTYLGHALAGLGRFSEALDAYGQALALQGELGEHEKAIESLAGLARVSLTRGDTAEAQTHVEEILKYLVTHSLEGADEPLRVYLTCFHVLRACHDVRTPSLLTTAYTLLQERAARIGDAALRHAFLENVPAHRELTAAWLAQDRGTQPHEDNQA